MCKDEELFRKRHPDYVFGNVLGSPYWDLFQDGFEQAENIAEKQIEKMKADVKIARDHSDEVEDIITSTVLNQILKGWGEE